MDKGEGQVKVIHAPRVARARRERKPTEDSHFTRPQRRQVAQSRCGARGLSKSKPKWRGSCPMTAAAKILMT